MAVDVSGTVAEKLSIFTMTPTNKNNLCGFYEGQLSATACLVCTFYLIWKICAAAELTGTE